MLPFDTRPFEFGNVPKTLEDGPAAVAEAMITGAGRCQSEAAQLMSRRTRAWLELPEHLRTCRTIPDVAQVQTEFLRHLWLDWLGASQRMSEAWVGAVKQMPERAPAEDGKAPERKDAGEADTFGVWEWWRIDMKGIAPRRSEFSGSAASRNSSTH